MKYARTRDGFIFEIEKNLGKYGTSKAVLICDMQGNVIDLQEQNNILKQADTIEDLCDRFIVEYESDNFTIFTDFRDLKKHFEYYPQDYHNVAGRYGAILVKGKGLIYKAKMNNEGKLELL